MLHDVCNAVNIYSRTPREERVHPLYWGSVSRRNINNSREGGGGEKYVRNRGCLSSHPIRVASYRGKAIPVIRFGKVGR